MDRIAGDLTRAKDHQLRNCSTSALQHLNMLYRFFPYMLLFITFTILYIDTFSRLFRGWFTYEDSHGLLILAIAVYIIWRKKGRLKELSPQPALLKGTSLLIIGCFILIAGKLSYTHIIQDVSLIFNILGIVLILGGPVIFKTLFIPIGYLIFIFPVFSEILGNFSLYLQQITALIGANILKIIGMPVLLSKQFIELPHIVLEVAQACNGINHIMALVALSIPMAILTHHSLSKRLLLILIAVLIGIAANGLRVALIGLWSAYKKSGPLHGPHDIFYVSFIFLFGMGLLLIVNRWFQKRSPNSKPLPMELELNGKNRKSHPGEDKNPNATSFSFLETDNAHIAKYPLPPLGRGKGEGAFRQVLIGMLIVFLTLTFLHFYNPRPVQLRNPLQSFPAIIEKWHGQDILPLKDFLNKIKADVELNRVYQDGSGKEAALFVRYFSLQEKGRSVTDYRFHLASEWEPVQINYNGSLVKINRLTTYYKNAAESIYFWYEVGNKTLDHHYWTKLYIFLNSLVRRHSNGAAIFVIFRNGQLSDSEKLNFIQTLFPVIKNHLSSHTIS